jgi:hypothetical protein
MAQIHILGAKYEMTQFYSFVHFIFCVFVLFVDTLCLKPNLVFGLLGLVHTTLAHPTRVCSGTVVVKRIASASINRGSGPLFCFIGFLANWI